MSDPKDDATHQPAGPPEPEPPKPAAAKSAGGPADIVSESLIGGTETFFAAQAELIAEVRAVALTWLRRRQDMINEAQQSLDEMRTCRTIADLLRVQQEWINRSMQRFASDVVAWGDTANVLSRKALQQIDAGSRGFAQGEKAPSLIAEAREKPGKPGKS